MDVSISCLKLESAYLNYLERLINRPKCPIKCLFTSILHSSCFSTFNQDIVLNITALNELVSFKSINAGLTGGLFQ